MTDKYITELEGLLTDLENMRDYVAGLQSQGDIPVKIHNRLMFLEDTLFHEVNNMKCCIREELCR